MYDKLIVQLQTKSGITTDIYNNDTIYVGYQYLTWNNYAVTSICDSRQNLQRDCQ